MSGALQTLSDAFDNVGTSDDTDRGAVLYTDGSDDELTLSAPDWYSCPPAGSDPAIAMTYRNRPHNTQQTHNVNVYFVGVPLDPGKTVSAAVLPDVSKDAVQGETALHVFAVGVR